MWHSSYVVLKENIKDQCWTKDQGLGESHIFSVTATSLKYNYILLPKPLYFTLHNYIALTLEVSKDVNSVPFRGSQNKRHVKVNFRLLCILLGTAIVLEKKELIGSFSPSLNSAF